MGWWTTDRQAYAVNYLVNAGLSPYGAAGLVSRWANVESTASGPTAVNPGRDKAFGIAQWLGARKAGIYPNTDFNAQLAYVMAELQRPESRDTGRGYQLLVSAQDANTAAVGATMYERAEGYNSATGRDNHTARTAAGVPAVLANAQTGAGAGPQPAAAMNLGSVGAGIGGGAAIAIIAGLALFWYLYSD